MQRYSISARFMRWLLALVLVSGGILSAQADLFTQKSDVESIPVEELQALMAVQPEARNIVLVDVRSPAEIAVSMIPGAISISEFEASRDQYRSAEVITYCTVLRSLAGAAAPIQCPAAFP